MLKLIDRQLVLGYLWAYVICLFSLLSLYIVVDLFTNLDEFTNNHDGFSHSMKHIATYYGVKLTHIFDRLSEAIALLAAMFTIAWMQHSNELIPLLSAGVSTRRVVLPILGAATAMIALSVVNQEMVLPRFAAMLTADKDDPYKDKEIPVPGAFESNGIHVEGRVGYRQSQRVAEFFVYVPEGIARNPLHLHAAEALYIKPEPGVPRTGGWLMTGTEPAELDGWERTDLLEMIDPGKYFLTVREADFDTITRNSKWFQFASTWNLYQELQKPDSSRLASMAVLFHTRLTRPILALILVVMGLSVLLRDQNRNVFISAGMCLLLCGLFFGAFFTCKSLGENDFLSPTLAAWLPVIVFGPLSVVMFDSVHT